MYEFHKYTTHDTGWRRVIGCLMFIGHFPQKSPILVANLRKVKHEIRHPMGLRHPVCIFVYITLYVYYTNIFRCMYIYVYNITYIYIWTSHDALTKYFKIIYTHFVVCIFMYIALYSIT